MAGAKAGGSKTARTNIEKYGVDYYKHIGYLGGKSDQGGVSRKGFASSGKASEAGRIGGLKRVWTPEQIAQANRTRQANMIKREIEKERAEFQEGMNKPRWWNKLRAA